MSSIIYPVNVTILVD